MNTSVEKIIHYCKQKKVYVYGTGNYGRIVMSFLKENNVGNGGFVESDEMLTENKIMGECVFALSCLPKDSRFIVSVGSNSRCEIEENLRNNNFNDYMVLSPEIILNISNEVAYKRDISNMQMVNVLVYHRIAKEIEFDTWNLAVKVENFEKQIKYIKENYQILRLDDNLKNVNENSIVITFDDGYADNYWNALPILEKYQVPATIFVSTQNLGTDNFFYWDYIENCIMSRKTSGSLVFQGERINIAEQRTSIINRVRDVMKKAAQYRRKELLLEFINDNPDLAMTKGGMSGYRSLTNDELKRLSESKYITIGAHGVTHTALACESTAMQKWEISESKNKLENIIDKEVNVFSYPYGGKFDYTKDTISLLKEMGFKKAVANWRGIVNKDTDLYQIPRTKMYDGSLQVCAREIRGSYCMYGDY